MSIYGNKFLQIGFLFILSLGVGQAQVQRCATDELHQHLEERNLFSSAGFQNIIEQTAFRRKSNDSLLIIPVVVHVVYSQAYSNISDAQVLDAIRVLNEDFQRLNADTVNTRPIFLPVAANTRIEFRLAKIDPDGLCTTGIVRHYNLLGSNLPNNIKETLSWPNDMYLNIFVGEDLYPGGLLGYAFYPNPGQNEENDGVMMVHFGMGSIGTASAGGQYNLGRTLTHEVGHILALPHTFDGGCFAGDFIDDTPPVDQPNFTCNWNINSCSNDTPNLPDQVENYMDYSNDACFNLFTQGQKVVMRTVLSDVNLRGYYSLPSNLIATGVLDTFVTPCDPLPDFYPSKRVICLGDTLTLTSNVYNGTADSLNWLFPGTSIPSNSDSMAKVFYTAPGTYDLGLEVFKNGTSNSVLRSDFIVVLPAIGKNISSGYAESFEDATGTYTEWNILHSGLRNRWERTNTAAYNGSYSMYVNGFDQAQNYLSYSYDQENLFFPPLDMTTLDSNMVLRFKYAFAPGSIGLDQLNLQMRWSCTAQWTNRLSLTGNALETVSNHPVDQPFFPGGPQDWKQVEIPLNVFKNRTHMMFRIQYINAGGNNLFIDEVEIVPQGLSISEVEESNLIVYPNPFTDKFQLDASGLDEVKIVVRNTAGQSIYTSQYPGHQVIEINSSEWPVGIYIIEATSKGKVIRGKLVKTF